MSNRPLQARAKLVEFIIEQVSDIRSQLAEVGSNPLNLKRQGGYRFGALQGILLARNDAGVGLTDTDVADNVVTLLFAGTQFRLQNQQTDVQEIHVWCP